MKCGCLAFIRFNSIKTKGTFQLSDFQAGQIPKRGALKIGRFFVERGWRGSGQEASKTLPSLYNQQKNKI